MIKIVLLDVKGTVPIVQRWNNDTLLN